MAVLGPHEFQQALDAVITALPRVAIDAGTVPAPLASLPGAWHWGDDGTRCVTITDAHGQAWRYVLPRDRAALREEVQRNRWALMPDLLRYVESHANRQ
jgi:hypothetical protein